MTDDAISYADALKRINAWRAENDCSPLTRLPDLSTHCERCGTRFTEKDLDGGRCLTCESMICGAPTVTDRPEEEPTRRIFVISFAPSYDEASSGGGEWFVEWPAARDWLAKNMDPGHDYRIITLDVPATMADDEITDFLGSGPGVDLVDPPDPREDLADCLECWKENGAENGE